MKLHPMRTVDDANTFRALNEEWISQHFRMEEQDRLTLGDPLRYIVHPGGQVFIATEDDRIVGTAALIRHTETVLELSKMTVASGARGRGYGRKLLLAMLEEDKILGGRTLFLGSSTKLPDAVHLYETVGFQHVSREQLPWLQYARASVYMLMQLEGFPPGETPSSAL